MKEKYRKRGSASAEQEYYDDHFQERKKKRGWFETFLVNLMPPPPDVLQLIAALGELEGKNVCELGCGAGLMTLPLLNAGASVSAIDISQEGVDKAKGSLKEFIPERLHVEKMDICSMNFPDEMFDFAIGAAILHHVDIDIAAREICRILKPGGKALFIEPLAHNPVVNLWRKLTPSIRTKDEWPLSYSEIKHMGQYFSSVEYREFYLLPMLASFAYLFTFSKEAKSRTAAYFSRTEKGFLSKFGIFKPLCGCVMIEFTR